jgi:signal transduction histidine kinase
MESRELQAAVVELLAATDPSEVRAQLVRLALEETAADRCTLTSVDRGVFRVEESYEPGGQPDFVGREYSLAYLDGQPLIAQALQSGEVVTGGTLATERTEPEAHLSLEAMRHVAIVPLRLGADTGGIFVLSRRRDERFDRDALNRVRDIGGMAVLALRNVRLLEGVTAAQRRGIDALTLISEHLAASESPRYVFFGRMSETVAGLAGARRAAFWLVHDDQLRVQPGAYGFSAAETAAMATSLRAAAAAGLSAVLYRGEALRAPRGLADDSLFSLIAPPRVANLLAVPWRTSEATLGMLVAYDSLTPFGDQDEWIMRLSARASALVLQSYNAQQRVMQLQTEELERMREHTARMAAVEQKKSDFLKLASHELRAPLTLIGGYLSMLDDGTFAELPSSLGPPVERMQAQVRRMNELVGQMLAAARLEDGQLELDIHETRVDDVVRDVVNATDTASHHIVVQADGPALAYADRRQVETIIGNLVSNAVKYSPAGGDISIAVEETDTAVEVHVRDPGIGMDEDELSALFRPFSRSAVAEVQGIEGVGLGLYLSRELARAQNGDITVVSTPGQGSTFTLRLPRRRATMLELDG